MGLERWNSLRVSSGTKLSYEGACVYLLPRAKDQYPTSLQGPPRDSCQEIVGEQDQDSGTRDGGAPTLWGLRSLVEPQCQGLSPIRKEAFLSDLAELAFPYPYL